MDISALNLLEGTDIGFLHVCDPCENHYFYNPDEDISLKNNLHPMKKKKGHSQASHGEMA